MGIPFTIEQFLDVFGTYNTAIWPVQVLAYLIGIVSVVLAFRSSMAIDRLLCAVLASYWIWMGLVYHLLYFRAINPLAWIFGAAFVIQGLLFLVTGVILKKISFGFTKKARGAVGAFFMVYAMGVYPVLSIIFEHRYPKAPMFGVAPCPTTIFTFGLLLWTTKAVPGYLLIIPLLWSLFGMSAALNLGIPEDFGLVVAGTVGTMLIMIENRKGKKIHKKNL